MLSLTKKQSLIIFLIAVVLFFAWRLLRPMNIFIVDDRFAWPIDTSQVPAVLGDLSARQCASCHPAFYHEWKTTIHSQAWRDPYFQADWKFDDSQHSCRLCHTPLDRQQPHTVLAYRDRDKWQPVLETNPAFDKDLQHEGVTCAACHYRDGKIVGVIGNTNAPHPVQKLDDPNRVCVRCHIVEGERWDTFFRFPPCGTVAEIESTQTAGTAGTGETTVSDVSHLGCVQCHMPLLERELVAGGEIRVTRQHLWRGGHDPAMVKSALRINFYELEKTKKSRIFRLSITNTGAAHYLPTGTPDRYLSIILKAIDAQGNIVDENNKLIKRTVMWRPLIIDLWDTRLQRGKERHYDLEIKNGDVQNDAPTNNTKAVTIEAQVSYHLLNETRRKRIDYKNTEAISYEVFRKQILLTENNTIRQAK